MNLVFEHYLKCEANDIYDFYMEATSYPQLMQVGRPDLMDKYNKRIRSSNELYKNPSLSVLKSLEYKLYPGTEEYDTYRTMNRWRTCSKCDGYGYADEGEGDECEECHGNGNIRNNAVEKDEIINVGDVRGILFKGDLYCMSANFNNFHWDILDKMIERNILTVDDFKKIGINSLNEFRNIRKREIQDAGGVGYDNFLDVFVCVIQNRKNKLTFDIGESYSLKTYNSPKLKKILSTYHISPYTFTPFKG